MIALAWLLRCFCAQGDALLAMPAVWSGPWVLSARLTSHFEHVSLRCMYCLPFPMLAAWCMRVT